MNRRLLLAAMVPAALGAAAACAATGGPHPSAQAATDAADSTRVWDARDVTTRPELANPDEVRREVAQHYPTLMHDAGVIGWASVEVVISREGTVERAKVVQVTNDRFDQPARAVALRMRFRPATVHGVSVAVRDTVPVRFDLSR